MNFNHDYDRIRIRGRVLVEASCPFYLGDSNLVQMIKIHDPVSFDGASTSFIIECDGFIVFENENQNKIEWMQLNGCYRETSIQKVSGPVVPFLAVEYPLIMNVDEQTGMISMSVDMAYFDSRYEMKV